MIEIEPERYYTIAEVAALAGISRRTVLRHCNKGCIKYRDSLSKHKRFKGEDVIEYIHKL